jgi:hypothetical protein
MSGTNLRTIWITLRAVNYTTAVFTNVITNMKGLDAATKQAINSSLNLGKSAFAAGMLFNVLGSQIGGAGGQLLQYASYAMFVVSALSYLKAVLIFLDGVLYSETAIVNGLASSWVKLGIAMGAAVAAFSIVYMITSQFGRTAGLVTGLAMAIIGLAMAIALIKGVVTFGSTAMQDVATFAAIGVAAGGAMGAIYAGTQHQMGTRMAEVTGPAILHHGEVVYNPATGRPTQIGNDLQGGRMGITTIDASMHVDTLNTKASKEELNELLRKQGRQIANDRR